eukprot:2202895-Amphidinium_carterae.1
MMMRTLLPRPICARPKEVPSSSVNMIKMHLDMLEEQGHPGKRKTAARKKEQEDGRQPARTKTQGVTQTSGSKSQPNSFAKVSQLLVVQPSEI